MNDKCVEVKVAAVIRKQNVVTATNEVKDTGKVAHFIISLQRFADGNESHKAFTPKFVTATARFQSKLSKAAMQTEYFTIQMKHLP